MTNQTQGFKKSDVDFATSIQDLLNHIDFDVENGQIWFGDKRMLLNHADALSRLREDLVNMLGEEKTQGLFFHYGYYAGLNDAEIARKIRPNQSWEDAYLAGPQLHIIRGMVKVDPQELEIDFETGKFYASFNWYNSFEAAYHQQHHGLSNEPVCFSLLGYASGYTSYFLGRQVLFKETQCAAMGHEHCRIVGKPIENWDEEVSFLQNYQPARLNTAIFAQRTELDELQRQHPSESINTAGFFNAIGQSPAFKQAIKLLTKVARSKATVLLEGETGVGKEVFAQALHQVSARSQAPFIAINCASIPHDLIESELFGVEKGAFTGATHTRKGKIELANGGTLFLDEVVELSPRAQASLLRVLQESEVSHVGSNQNLKVDVRIVVATNESLEEAVESGKFRQDLFYRINTFPIRIPPLRERTEDILLLAEFFLKKFRDMYEKSISGFTEAAKTALLAHPWKGNVRELQNLVERAVILTNSHTLIDVEQLFGSKASVNKFITPFKISSQGGRLTTLSQPEPDDDMHVSPSNINISSLVAQGFDLELFNQQIIETALKLFNNNISETARKLNISRAKLDYRIKASQGKTVN